MLCILDYGIENIVIGMAHRGKLEILTCLLHFQPAQMFAKVINTIIVQKNHNMINHLLNPDVG